MDSTKTELRLDVGSQENDEKSQYRWSLSRYLNPGPSECEPGVPTTRQKLPAMWTKCFNVTRLFVILKEMF